MAARSGRDVPSWTGERLLPRLAPAERVFFLARVKTAGAIAVLAVTSVRVLVVTDPRVQHGPSMVRSAVSGTLWVAGRNARLEVRDGRLALSFNGLDASCADTLGGLLPLVLFVDEDVVERPARPTQRPQARRPSGPGNERIETPARPEQQPGAPRSQTAEGNGRTDGGKGGSPASVPPPFATAAGLQYRLELHQPVWSWQDAEALAANLLSSLGFHNERVTPSGPDAGVDAVADGAVAQAKHQQQVVGAPVVQALYGVAQSRGAQGVFLASSRYSPAAVRFAEDTGVALYVFDDAGTVTARSSRAEALIQAAQKQDSTWSSRMKVRLDRLDAAQASEEIQRLTGHSQWLMAVAGQRQRRDGSRKEAKAVSKALGDVNAALQALKQSERTTGPQRKAHLAAAKRQVKSAAGHLGVKVPR